MRQRTIVRMPLLSVITAMHTQAAGWFDATASSVLNQQLPASWEIEWLVQIDGVSPCHVPVTDERVRVEAAGYQLHAAGARNLALARSRGDAVMHLDADDLLADGALTKLIPPLDSGQGIGWTSGAVDDLHADGTRTQFPPQLLGHVKKGTPGKYWLEHQVMAFHSVAFICQRHLAAAVGGYPALQASEDTSFVLAATGLADGYVTSDVVAMYRRWEGQTVGRSPSYMATRQAARQLVAERVAALEHLANSRDSSVDDSDISGRVEHATTRPSPDRHDRVPRA